MGSVYDVTSADALLKETYADHVKEFGYGSFHYTNAVKPLKADMQPGGNYVLPVILSSEEGVTMSAARKGAFNLRSPETLSTEPTSVEGAQLMARAAIDLEMYFRSKSKNSFIASTKQAIKSLIKTSLFYKEATSMWGQSGIGTIASVDTAANTFVVTLSQFAPGLWIGSKNRLLRIQNGSTSLGTCKISAVDIDTRIITVDALPSGVAAGNTIYLGAGLEASGASEMLGIYKIISDTTSSIFGIDGSTNDLWRPAAAYDVVGELTFEKVILAIIGPVNRGLGGDGREHELVVNPATWASFGADEAALRKYDASYTKSKAINGQEDIEFHTQCGKITIIAHPCMKEGYAFMHEMAGKVFQYVGACPQPEFALPGMVNAKGEQSYFRALENNSGFETRLYWNNAIFTENRCQMRLLSGIVNQAH